VKEWLYVKQGKQFGPLTLEELRALAASGGLDRADLVWKQGMTTWTQAGSVEGIFPADPAPASPDYAGFGIRTAARAVDSVCTIVFGFFAGIAGGVAIAVLNASGRLPPDWHDRLARTSAAPVVFGVAALLAYHSLSEGLGGASIGKLVCGLRVVRTDGAPAGLGAGAIRTLGFLLDSLFFGLVAYSKMSKSALQQRYGDVWADTVVVKSGSVAAASRRSAGAVVGGVVLGASLAALFDVAGVLWKILG
jgi:uncharacterized RDD family membrane protein YckC